jgi:hypothetical protein
MFYDIYLYTLCYYICCLLGACMRCTRLYPLKPGVTKRDSSDQARHLGVVQPSLSRRRIKHFGCAWITHPLMRSQLRISTLFSRLISYLINLPELGYFPRLTSGRVTIRFVSNPKIYPRPHSLRGMDYLNIWLCLSD